MNVSPRVSRDTRPQAFSQVSIEVQHLCFLRRAHLIALPPLPSHTEQCSTSPHTEHHRSTHPRMRRLSTWVAITTLFSCEAVQRDEQQSESRKQIAELEKRYAKYSADDNDSLDHPTHDGSPPQKPPYSCRFKHRRSHGDGDR